MPNPERLFILTELREQIGLSLAEMARQCGLSGRQARKTVSLWEQGAVTPRPKRQAAFKYYLWDTLRLRNEPKRFKQIWEILVEEWNWESLAQEGRGWLQTGAAEQPANAPVRNPKTPDIDETALLRGKSEQWQIVLPIDELPDPGPLPRGSKMPFGRNPLFVGRTRELIDLAAALNSDNAAAISQVETAAATGLGGIGKTQLASEFVHRYGKYFPGGVFWLSFDNERAVSSTIAACGDADALNLQADFALRPLDEQVRLVQTAWQEPIPRLLIFDNCEDPDLLVRWRPPSGGCRILVTSRRGEWERILGVQMLPIDVLSRSESIDLLQRLAPHADVDILAQIAEELGDLPLALHLAGSYIDHYRRAITPEIYLEQLRNPDLLAHPSLHGHGHSPTGHIQHVGRTFAISYDQLDENHPTDALAQSLLVCLAHFAPGEPVWYELLERMVVENPGEVDAALQVADGLARLIELGLVDTEQDSVVRMHRLVAAFVRQVAKDRMRETQHAVEQVVFDEMARTNRRGYPMPLLARQVHLRSVVDRAQPRADELSAALCMELSTYLWQVSEFEDAQRYCERALSIRRALWGENHTATAECLNMMGKILRDLGELSEARQFFAQALAIRERELGADHLHVAETLNHLGWLLWHERAKEPTQEYLERALTIAEKRLGRNHRITAEYANNLGLCFQDCVGDLDSARHYFALALQIREQVLDDKHPLMANSLNNMGYIEHARGELDAARSYYERTLALRRTLWQDDHPDIAVSLKNLGTVIQDQGDLAEARRLLEQALAIYIRSVGEEHLRTSFCLDSLGVLLHEQGDLDDARDFLTRALSIRRATYREDHPNLTISLAHLGAVLADQGQMDAARAHLQEALSIRSKVLGEDHPLTRESAALLAGLGVETCGER